MTYEGLHISLALLCLLILTCWALFLGYDGAILVSVIGIFGYVAGYKHRKKRVPNNSPHNA